MTTPPMGRRREASILDDPRLPYPIRVLAALVLYVTGPLALYRRNVVAAGRTVRTFTADDEVESDPALTAYVAAAETALQSAGFGPPHRVVQRNAPNVTGFGSLLEYASRGDLATVMGLRSENAAASPILVSAITFTTEFSDDVTLATSNVTTIRRFPNRPRYEPVVFRDVHDPLELYRLHRCRVDERRRRTPALATTRGATPEKRIAYQERETEKVYEHWVRSGYYRRTGNVLRPTLRGAALATWRGLWPWRQLTERRLLRDARAVRQRCEGAGPTQPQRR